MMLCVLLHLLVGTMGFVAFRNDNRLETTAGENILELFPPNDIAVAICKIVYGLSILLSVPCAMVCNLFNVNDSIY